MKLRSTFAFLLAVSCAFLAPAPTLAKTAAPAPQLEASTAGISAYRLANGFKIILAPYPAAANARIELLVKSGSKVEGYGETGMAHLLEHMLFKSAGPRRDLKSDLTKLGAHWNGTTTADRTNFFETVAAEPAKIDEALRIEADRFIRASFTAQHLKSEMTVVRNELERGENSPSSVAFQFLLRQSYFWHGYGRPTIGARSDIEDAPFAALQAFHDRNYRPDNAVLIVSGNFDPAHVLALACQLFAVARNPATPPVKSWTREEPRAATGHTDLYMPAGKTIAASAWRLPGHNSRETYAFDLAVNAICDDDWGSLRKDLVLDRKLAVSVSCGTYLQADYGLLIASASAGKDADAGALSQALTSHVEAAAQRGISAEQLARARQNELTAFTRIENNHEQLAAQLSEAEVAGDWRLFFWQRDMVQAIGVDEANAALKKWLVPLNRNDVLVHQADHAQPVVLPAPAAAVPLVGGKTWPAVAKAADPVPESADQLARLVQRLPLPADNGALMIARHTQGDLAWLAIDNDYGNATALSGRDTACGMAGSLLAYGGAGLSRDQLSEKLDALQAQWTLGLGGITLEAPRDQLPAALELLLAVWAAPTLPADEFDRVKSATIAQLEAAQKDPGSVAISQAHLRFDNFPSGHPHRPQSLDQQLAEARAVTLADVRACVADFGGRGRIRIGLVGNFQRTDLQQVWDKVAVLPAARVAYQRVDDPAAPTRVDTAPIEVAMADKPNASVAGLALLPISDESPDFPALRVAVKILGGDADSRIWMRLRETEGLAYGAGVSLSGSTFEPRSSLVIQASAASPKAGAALASLQDEVAKALRDGFSEAEAARAKAAWLQERKTGLSGEKYFAGTLADGLYAGRDYAWIADYDRRIATVTAAQASAALRKYLGPTPIVWLVGRGQQPAP
jgi:zinc protease